MVSCRTIEPTPTTEQKAWPVTLIPVTVASTGKLIVPQYATIGSCVCPAAIVTVENKVLDVMFNGLFHSAAPPIGKLPALIGTWVTLASDPEFAVAYPTVPRIPDGLVHTLPTPADTASVGTLGPMNSPTKEVAFPNNPVYVPGAPETIAMNVPRTGLTEMTTTVCPFKKNPLPRNPLRMKLSFGVGAGPVYENSPMEPLLIITVVTKTEFVYV